MSSSPEWRSDAAVLRGSEATGATAVRFDVDLRGAQGMRETAEQARAAARAAGYADGWAQGQRAAAVAVRAATEAAHVAAREAETVREAALARAVTAVGQAAAGLRAREVALLADLEDAVLAAGVAVAEALLGYELSTAEDRGVAAVRRALAMAPEDGPVTVRLHPADHATLGGSEHDVDGRPVRLRADATLAPGDAIAECGPTTVDATLGAALARVREVLAR